MKKVLLIAVIGILFSCSNTESYEKIQGEWKCASWINKARGIDKCRNNVYFKFQDNKSYYSTIGNASDSGKYRILNDMLYVMPRGKMEIAVRITKLNADTLEYLMNQSGEAEILTLVRK